MSSVASLAMESSEMCCSASSLPNDLLHRILSLLPLPTLFRLRCVCKLWRSLPFSLLFVDFSSSSPLMHQPDALHHWFFAFRLLARKVNEHHTFTYKSTMYVYSIAYDREMLGSSGHFLQAEESSEVEKRCEILNTGSPLAAHLDTGVLDIAGSANGLLLLALRLQPSHNHEDFSLRLFVYNPISKDLRGLPTTQWASQKLSMIALPSDGGEKSAYKIYSLGRHYRPGTTNLLYSFEVYNSEQAALGWQFLSHVNANLSGSGDLHPGSETALMGYFNSKALCNHELGFLYWMPSLQHKAEAGRYTELQSCDMNSGFYYRLPGLTYKTSFANMWSHPTGLQLVCGVAKEGDLLITCAVEIWELHQGKEDPKADEDYYGARRLPPGYTQWQCIDKMPHDLWDELTGGGNRRIACAVSTPLVFVIAEHEEEKMVIYNTNHKMWKLLPSWAILHQLFNDKHPHYYQVFPWIISFFPNPCSVA